AGTRGRYLLTVCADMPREGENAPSLPCSAQPIAEKLAIPGLTGAARYESIEGAPRYLTLYELGEANVLRHPALTALKARQNDCDQRAMPNIQIEPETMYECILGCGEPAEAHAPFLVSVRMEIAPQVEREFNDWYNVEHMPRLAAVPGVVAARRY